MNKLLFITLILFSVANAQTGQNLELDQSNELTIPKENQIKIEIKMGVENEDLQTYFDFNNIMQSKFKISGATVKNKAFVIKLKEFKGGKLSKTETLFDEGNNKYFKTDSTTMSFKLLTQIGKENLKTWIRGKSFGSKKSYFELEDENKDRYVTKDFIGGKEYLIENINKPFYLLAIITPYFTESGAGQYCQVAYSGMNPERFGEKFNIPHYFLIQMEFVD